MSDGTHDVLEPFASAATSIDDHHILHNIGHMMAARGGLFPLNSIQRAPDVESPDVVRCLQPISATEHPDFVLVQHVARPS